MALVKQPTAGPTRKMWAVILTGIIMGAIMTVTKEYAPDMADDVAGLEVWINAGVMAFAGYWTKDRA